MKGHYPLAKVKELVAAGLFRLGKVRAKDELAEYLGDANLEARSRAFAQAVFVMLDDSHFAETEEDMNLDGDPAPYDIYGLGIGQTRLVQLGFPDDEPVPLAWYVKFAIVQDQGSVFVVSLHRLQFDLKRPNNSHSPLKPRVSDD